jgi:adenine-specific DNA-methyltransferase
MSKPIDATVHRDQRLNIPTGEMEPFVADADRAPLRVEYDRRKPGLDPQLIWRGKGLGDDTLTAVAPPIYLQEQIHPKALIEDLRAGRARADDLFGHFGVEDGDTEAAIEFYSHAMRWSNRMILGDALQVMASLAEREGLRGKVQAIYIDPPYGIRFNSNFQWSTTSRDVKDGNLDHLTREPEQVKAFRDTWRDGIHSYLGYLRDRLTVARELLTESGSCFVQIGDENVHRVRALMDEVFGEANIVSLIPFAKTGGQTSDVLSSVCDYIVWYARDRSSVKYRQPFFFKERGGTGSGEYSWIELDREERRRATKMESENEELLPKHVRFFIPDNFTSNRPPGDFPIEFEGISGRPRKGYWKTGELGTSRLKKAGRFIRQGQTLRYMRYLQDFPVSPQSNMWMDTAARGWGEDKVYVVQTGFRVIERCLLMTTDPGDLVLDPTCGSGTTAFVAEQWGRRWITIDTSRVALALARARLMGAKFPFHLLADSPEGRRKESEITRTPARDTPTHNDLRQGFVYERVPHIMLRDIANNEEIDRIWDRMQPAVEAARAALNAALAGQPEPFEVETGGRAGKAIDFRERGEVKLPSGEPAPAGGFMEWEIPREPGTPWPSPERDAHAAARAFAEDAPKRLRTKAEAGLHALNAARGTAWTFATLPERPVTPWPEPAVTAHGAFWQARIARQREIDASIAAKADFEYLYDKPYPDNSRIRVAGPFTVETLSPHRTPAIGPDGEMLPDAPAAPSAFADAPEDERDAFFRAIVENLVKAGVHQQDKGDRIAFTSVTPWPGRYVGAEGRYLEGETERRAAILVGPEYGTVQRADLVAAAREAQEAGFDILIACAFNYDAHADLDRIGALPILRARMNPDLHMAGELKAGGGNLFVVFGEPDLVLHRDGDTLRVEIRGVDVFRPQTGEIDSVGPEGIACWFVDTDYSGESFFVRQAYFLGAGDPYKALKTTLKGEISEEAWDSLNSATSRPFPRPASGKVAVKAINHLGDEVMRVFDV